MEMRGDPFLSNSPKRTHGLGSRVWWGSSKRSMYGTRDAPAIWAEEVQKAFVQLGLQSCISNPCVFHDRSKDIIAVAHVDDIMVVAPTVGVKAD